MNVRNLTHLMMNPPRYRAYAMANSQTDARGSDLTKHLWQNQRVAPPPYPTRPDLEAPMRRHGRTEPHRHVSPAALSHTVITKSNAAHPHRKTHSSFTASFGGITDALQLLDRQRIHDAQRFTARAVNLEPAMPITLISPRPSRCVRSCPYTVPKRYTPTHRFTPFISRSQQLAVTRRTTATVFR